MSKQPSRAFASAFAAAMSDTAVQVARHEGISKRMTAAATAAIASLVLGLTAAPAPAHAQNGNQVARGALDVVGSVVGGAIGAQIGGGNGKKAATVAGAAAGVWAAEALQSGSLQPQRGRVISNDSFGPVISSGWTNTRMPSAAPAPVYSRGAQSEVTTTRLPARQLALQSGTTQMSEERMGKLIAMEGSFLKARDGYARAIYASEQAEDDVALDAGNRGVQQKLSAASAQERQAQGDYNTARTTFVNAVQHMGERGYDVHYFAHSYNLSQARVTAGDMRRGDVVRETRGARIVERYDDADSVRGESFGNR
jgi:outer membrane lipoprotein SlyB